MSAHARTCTSQAAKITYLHNAAGQRVFKSEPQTAQTLPDEQTLGTGFVDWLRRNFQWLYASAQTNASIGTAYSFADQSLPSWALLGEYDNGSASGAGRVEYIWLPTDDGSAIPVAMFRGNRYFNIHSDHLGTPRLIKDDTAKPTWQWAYSAFGDNKPTGILKATTNSNAAITNQPTLLQATGAMEFNLRFPGQYLDQETGQFYNYYRTYMPNQGRYTQNDPIGLDGGWNRMGYVEGNPLMLIDPRGLRGGSNAAHRNGPPTVSSFGCMGLACVTGGTHNSSAQMSAELSFGGGIEICDPPPPPKPICSNPNPTVQPPGIPVPSGGGSRLTMRGGLFIGPSVKADGSICIRFGPHYTVPLTPSVDLGDMRR